MKCGIGQNRNGRQICHGTVRNRILPGTPSLPLLSTDGNGRIGRNRSGNKASDGTVRDRTGRNRQRTRPIDRPKACGRVLAGTPSLPFLRSGIREDDMDGDVMRDDGATGRLRNGVFVIDANRDEFVVSSGGEELLEKGDDLEALLSEGFGGLSSGGRGGGRGS